MKLLWKCLEIYSQLRLLMNGVKVRGKKIYIRNIIKKTKEI